MKNEQFQFKSGTPEDIIESLKTLPQRTKELMERPAVKKIEAGPLRLYYPSYYPDLDAEAIVRVVAEEIQRQVHEHHMRRAPATIANQEIKLNEKWWK